MINSLYMPKQRNKELIQSYSPRYQLMENPSLAPNLFPDYMFPDLPFTSPYCYQYSFSLQFYNDFIRSFSITLPSLNFFSRLKNSDANAALQLLRVSAPPRVHTLEII